MQAETTAPAPGKPKPRTVQEVFNVVLDAGLYGVGKPYYFMCNALACAVGGLRAHAHYHPPGVRPSKAEYRRGTCDCWRATVERTRTAW